MLFGHKDKIQAFCELARSGRLGQAYLFFGDTGVGKETFARSFAYYLEGGSFEPHGIPFVDTKILNPGDGGSIGVDQISELKKFLWQTPLKSSRRIVIVDEAHALTNEAQSALLKIVEEPPAHSLLIFITFEPQSLFPPLLSRLTKIYFPRFSSEQIKEILMEARSIPQKKAEAIASRSFGRLGFAFSLLSENKENDQEDFEKELEEKILSLWNSNAFQNSRAIRWLLDREMNLKRFSLNTRLQKKACEYVIQKNRVQ